MLVQVVAEPEHVDVDSALPKPHPIQQPALNDGLELAGAVDLNSDDLNRLTDLQTGGTQSGTFNQVQSYETEEVSNLSLANSLRSFRDSWFEQWGI